MNKSQIFTCALFLSLWLVKALQLSATPALLCSDRRCSDIVDPQMILPISNLTTAFFVIGGGNGNTSRKPLQHDQKAAKNCFRYDCISHPLPVRSNPRPQP